MGSTALWKVKLKWLKQRNFCSVRHHCCVSITQFIYTVVNNWEMGHSHVDDVLDWCDWLMCLIDVIDWCDWLMCLIDVIDWCVWLMWLIDVFDWCVWLMAVLVKLNNKRLPLFNAGLILCVCSESNWKQFKNCLAISFVSSCPYVGSGKEIALWLVHALLIQNRPI